MHIYIYASFITQKKYDSTIAKIETRITDLGLNGKIIRLNMLQSLDSSIQDEIKKGAKTIIAVGDDLLLHDCINSLMHFYSNSNIISPIPIGFIPIGSKNINLADKLGIPSGVSACNILSARRIEKINIGKINNAYFISEATITTNNTAINVNNDYSIEINEAGEIGIINIPNEFTLPPNYKSSAQDGRLEFCIKTKKTNKFLSIGNKQSATSVFSFDELFIKNTQNQNILLDSVASIATPVKIRISKKKLNLIVGKERSF